MKISNQQYIEEYGCTIDILGHAWGEGWQESETPHPGFGGTINIFGAYVGQCYKCGMYDYECYGLNEDNPGKYQKQLCGSIIRGL